MSEFERRAGRIRNILLTDGGSFSRADMDELAILVYANEESYPERFVNVVKDFDTKFSFVVEAQKEFLGRLQRLLEVYSDNDLVDNRHSETDALIPTFLLNDADRDRVLELCSEIRKIILHSDFLTNRIGSFCLIGLLQWRIRSERRGACSTL